MSSTLDGGAAEQSRGRHAAERPRGRLRGIGTAPMQLVAGLARTITAPAEVPVPRSRRAVPQPRPAITTAVAEDPAPVRAPGEYVEHTVAEGETVSDVAQRFGVSTAALLALNGLGWRSPIAHGDVLLIRRSAETRRSAQPTDLQRHRVGDGEDVAAVARRYGVSTAAVLLANGLSRGSRVMPGQRLVIPTPLARRGDAVVLEGRMRANAAAIVAEGRDAGVPDDGIVAALCAAMAASCLFSLDVGEDGAVGLFQLHPGPGWGSVDDLADPAHAARAFFTGGPRTRGLLGTPGWELQSVGDVACAVRGGPSATVYARWEAAARQWLADLDAEPAG